MLDLIALTAGRETAGRRRLEIQIERIGGILLAVHFDRQRIEPRRAVAGQQRSKINIFGGWINRRVDLVPRPSRRAGCAALLHVVEVGRPGRPIDAQP